MGHRTKKSVLFLLVSFFLPLPLQAIVIIPASLQQIAHQADIVANLSFVERYKEKIINPETKQEVPVWVNVFKTLDVLKGDVPATFEFQQLAISSRREAFQYGLMGLYDPTTFEAGKEYILCLSAPNRLGLRSIVGYNQGKFDVVQNGQGKMVFNPGLPQKSLGKSERTAVQAPPGPIPYDDFASILRKALK